MQPFAYNAATSEQQALSLSGSSQSARYVAGGTTLIDLMKLHVEIPQVLIDINPLPASQIVQTDDGGVRIGALVRNSDCAYSELIRNNYPVLSEAILSGASAQLRNMATTGGNVLQRTRCYYFRDTSQPCNKRQPGSGCSAIGGFNRIHAVLGTNQNCIASNPSDMNVALMALGAFILTASQEGGRRIPIAEFYRLPGERPDIETVLEPGELITAVDLPPLPFAKYSHYIKVRDRASYAFALSSAAVALDIDSGAIREARVALGGVGYRPWRATEAEEFLLGKPSDRQTFRAAAELALKNAVAYRDNAFKVELAKRTMIRTLTAVASMADQA